MTEAIRVELFAEDRAHEELLRPLIRRIAQEENVAVDLRVRSARGGHGKALSELKAYQGQAIKRLDVGLFGLLVVAIDANCQTYARMRRQILAAVDSSFRDLCVVACPDPHVERWYLADPAAFHEVAGTTPSVPRGKCERDFYKSLLRDTLAQGGNTVAFGGIEFGPDLAEAMDLHRAGRDETSLKHFIDDLRRLLRRL